MTKNELIDHVAESEGISASEAATAVETILSTIVSELAAGGKVTLPGFGTFKVSDRAARTGRNPQTGAEMQIKASRVARFTAGAKLKAEIQ